MLNCSIRRRIETKPITLKSMSPENASHLYGETTIEKINFQKEALHGLDISLKLHQLKL